MKFITKVQMFSKILEEFSFPTEITFQKLLTGR